MTTANQLPSFCPTQLEQSPTNDLQVNNKSSDWDEFKDSWLGRDIDGMSTHLEDVESDLPFHAEQELHFVLDGVDNSLVVDSDGYVRQFNLDGDYSKDYAQITLSDIESIASIRLLLSVKAW